MTTSKQLFKRLPPMLEHDTIVTGARYLLSGDFRFSHPLLTRLKWCGLCLARITHVYCTNIANKKALSLKSIADGTDPVLEAYFSAVGDSSRNGVVIHAPPPPTAAIIPNR